MDTQTANFIFPSGVALAVATPDMYEEEPLFEEAPFIRTAIEKRRREFVAGRSAARRAIGKLRTFHEPILVNSDRTPKWPEDIVGSISHCDRFCGAAVGFATNFLSIGFDAETNEPIDKAILPQIFDRWEIAHLRSLSGHPEIMWEKVGFSAKEAFYKCFYPHTKQYLSFRDVKIRVEIKQAADQGEFVIIVNSKATNYKKADEYTGKFIVNGGIICTSVVFSQ